MSAGEARMPVAGTTTSATPAAAATQTSASQSTPTTVFPPPPPPSGAVSESTFRASARSHLSQPVVAAFIAGGVAGAVSRTVVSPLERLKILFQVQSVGREEYKGSVAKGLAKIWREEGFKGMMRGNGTNCIRIVPYSAVQFGSYNIYKRYLFEPVPGAELSAGQRLVCGGLAGITSVTSTYPMDIVRTRLSIQSASFAPLAKGSGSGARAVTQRELPGMFSLLMTMYRTEGGLGAWYRGIIPTVAGVAPYVGLNFMVYESIRSYLSPAGRNGQLEKEKPSVLRRLLAGALSGGIAQTCTYPFDVLRRRFQINTMPGMGLRYNSIWDAIRIMFREEGIRGFYKGLWPNLLKVAPSMASSWVSFELTRDALVGLSREV